MFRAVARPLLASPFLLGGWRQLRSPETVAPKAAPVVSTIANHTPLPDDPALLVRVNGAVMMAAGAALTTGTATRLSSVVLAGTLVPTTIAGHPFWSAAPENRTNDVAQFCKNAGMFAGLLLLATQPTRSGGSARTTRRAKRRGAGAAGATRTSVGFGKRELRSQTRAARRELRSQARAARRQVAATVDAVGE